MMREQEQLQWQAWLKDRSQTARDWIFGHYHPWSKNEAKSWQHKLFLSLADIEDFRQYAAIGLLEAIAHFDPQLGYKFVMFARFRVKGAILNEVFRYSDDSAQFHAAYSRGDEIVDDDVISAKPLVELKDSIEELATAYLISDTMVEHPQSWIYGDYYSSTELSCLKIRYMDQLLRLADPMQSIMLFRYQLDWDFTAIANMLGVSKGRVSQLHKAALDALRSNRAETDVDDDDEFFQLSGIPA